MTQPSLSMSRMRAIAAVLALVVIQSCAQAADDSVGDLRPSPGRVGSGEERLGGCCGPVNLPADFIGEWQVHGAQLNIESLESGSLVHNVQGCAPESAPCVEKARLRFALEDDALLAEVTDVRYYVGDTEVPQAAVENPINVDDSFILEFIIPGLLRRTIIHGFSAFEGGNQFWCGDPEELVDEFQRFCGA